MYKQCINAYHKNQRRIKELQRISKEMNNKMNKTVKTKSLADYPVWIIGIYGWKQYQMSNQALWNCQWI